MIRNIEDVATVFGIFLLGLVVGLFLGTNIENFIWEQEMVNRGYAEWQIIKGTREVKFKWKENQ